MSISCSITVNKSIICVFFPWKPHFSRLPCLAWQAEVLGVFLCVCETMWDICVLLLSASIQIKVSSAGWWFVTKVNAIYCFGTDEAQIHTLSMGQVKSPSSQSHHSVLCSWLNFIFLPQPTVLQTVYRMLLLLSAHCFWLRPGNVLLWFFSCH